MRPRVAPEASDLDTGTGPRDEIRRAAARVVPSFGAFAPPPLVPAPSIVPPRPVITSADRGFAALVAATTTAVIAAALAILAIVNPGAITLAIVAAAGIPVAAIVGRTFAIAFLPGQTRWWTVPLAIVACELGNLEIWGSVAAGSLAVGLAGGDVGVAANALLFGAVGVLYCLVGLPVTIPTVLLSIEMAKRLHRRDTPQLRRALRIAAAGSTAAAAGAGLVVAAIWWHPSV